MLPWVVHVVGMVSFVKSSYFGDEHDRFIRLQLLLSNELSFDFIVQVIATDGTATGELWSDWILTTWCLMVQE